MLLSAVMFLYFKITFSLLEPIIRFLLPPELLFYTFLANKLTCITVFMHTRVKHYVTLSLLVIEIILLNYVLL